MATKLVALKLTPTEALALAQLVEHGPYKSISAALREGLMYVLESNSLSTDAADQIRLERMKHVMRRTATKKDQGFLRRDLR